jgi:hypothetical protein
VIFGDGYLLNEFIKNLNIYPLINSLQQHKEIIPLICRMYYNEDLDVAMIRRGK